MTSLPPLLIAAIIIAIVGAIGLVIYFLRHKSTFSGYEHLAPEARAIARALNNAETFRDGNDLVISGNHKKLPVIIRFSYDENTPGLNIHMKAPAVFTMSVVPKGARATEGRVLVRTPDEMFDARFTTRSDNPTQAKMFTSGRQVMQSLQKLCCSTKTFFTVTQGALELSELTIPEPYTAKHVGDHIEALGRLAAELEGMPGSETMKIRAMQRDRSSWFIRAAVAAGVVAAVMTVVAATQQFGKPAVLDIDASSNAPEGVLPFDAALIPRLQGWRLADPDDFNSAARSWMRGSGAQPAGRIEADFTGQDIGVDSAYVLVNENDGKKRVVLIADNRSYLDAIYDDLAIVARVPRRAVGSIEWATPPTEAPVADGLLIVPDVNDMASGTVVFVVDGRVTSGKPADYQRVLLR